MDWDQMTQEQKIEKLSRDLSIIWYVVFIALGVAGTLAIEYLVN